MFWKSKKRYGLEVDVLVVGTGGAGMTAALAAHDRGARVALVEKSERVGGTTAVSGGVLWIPNNHHMPEVDIPDSRDEALAYTRRLADGRSDDRLIEAFIDTAPTMIRWLEERTPLRFKALARYPDYHPEFQGGKFGGRSLDPGLFDTHALGAWKDKLRRSPVFGATAMTVAEATEWGVFSKPLGLPYKLLGERFAKGLVCYGGALAGGLLQALLDRKVEPMLSVAARELVVEDDRVVGLAAERGGQELLIRAKKGVILASGGFEWNKELGAQFLSGQVTHPNSPPTNEGDGLKMAMALGADLGNMSEAWWCPSVVVPGEEYDGRPLSRGDFAIRSLPRSIIVNRRGRRFVNEAHNYNDMMKPFFAFDPVSYERPNLPAWLVLDQGFRDRYMLVTVLPGMKSPPWLAQADTLGELARKVGIDPEGLAATVERFNALAREGADRDFRRGESAYDHFYGDPENKPNPNLGPIEKPPFYALQVFPGSIGTKGGPRVDADAQVLRVDGSPIAGLYAAGNVMAGVTGPGYPGAGSTIGTGMTFGFLAAHHATSDKRG
jgi:succinate dehydrogenase/fumarate reductase flavoprotein subunit